MKWILSYAKRLTKLRESHSNFSSQNPKRSEQSSSWRGFHSDFMPAGLVFNNPGRFFRFAIICQIKLAKTNFFFPTLTAVCVYTVERCCEMDRKVKRQYGSLCELGGKLLHRIHVELICWCVFDCWRKSVAEIPWKINGNWGFFLRKVEGWRKNVGKTTRCCQMCFFYSFWKKSPKEMNARRLERKIFLLKLNHKDEKIIHHLKILR